MKKGIELSVNVIIIAAISLIVLVLLSFLVIRSGGGIVEGTSCEQVGGNCISPTDYELNDNSCGEFQKRDITKSCSEAAREAGDTICCISIGG